MTQRHLAQRDDLVGIQEIVNDGAARDAVRPALDDDARPVLPAASVRHVSCDDVGHRSPQSQDPNLSQPRRYYRVVISKHYV